MIGYKNNIIWKHAQLFLKIKLYYKTSTIKHENNAYWKHTWLSMVISKYENRIITSTTRVQAPYEVGMIRLFIIAYIN